VGYDLSSLRGFGKLNIRQDRNNGSRNYSPGRLVGVIRYFIINPQTL
jgi:hypothetical protein